MEITWIFAKEIHKFLLCQNGTACLNKPNKLGHLRRHSNRSNNNLVHGVNVRSIFE